MDNRRSMQTVESLCARYGLDMTRAQHVAATATQLFDEMCRLELRRFDARERELLQTGATLLDVGAGLDPTNHHLTGRDLVLATPLQGFSQVERAILACIVGFHDGDAQPERESLLTALDGQQRQVALALAAFARVADGLDATHTQTTAIRVVKRDVAHGNLIVHVHGPHSHDDAERACARADLWHTVFGVVTFDGYLTSPGISADDPLAEACRKTLRYRLDWAGSMSAWQILAPDQATPERVRKLRAAARRMRNDLRIFGSGLRAKRLQPISEGLQVLSNTLRRVRTYDALLASLSDYSERCDEEDRDGLAPLMNLWYAERTRRAEQLLAFMSSDGYQDWLDAMQAFVAANAGRDARAFKAGKPSRVRHIVQPVMARHLACIRSYDVLPDSPDAGLIHALRVAIRRLRYAIEALQDVLPAEEAHARLRACAAAQESYGAIHRACEAARHAMRLVSANQADRPRDVITTSRIVVRGIAEYAEAQRRVAAARLSGWRDHLEAFLL